MSDPWDAPEGQTQHCEACEDEIGGMRAKVEHRCAYKRPWPKDLLAKHGTWFWAGYGKSRVRVIVDEEQPKNQITMLPEKPPVRMKRIGWMTPDHHCYSGQNFTAKARIADNWRSMGCAVTSVYARKDDL